MDQLMRLLRECYPRKAPEPIGGRAHVEQVGLLPSAVKWTGGGRAAALSRRKYPQSREQQTKRLSLLGSRIKV